jgi:hypothetical protein
MLERSGRVEGTKEQPKSTPSSDAQLVIQFCLIGLLVTLILMLRFPDLGAVIEQYNQF